MKSIFAFFVVSLFVLSCSSDDSGSSSPDPQMTTIPTLTTGEISQITANSAAATVNISNDGGGTLLRKGLCWDIEPNPTISDSRTEEDTNDSNFSSTITNLMPNTLYYVRAYASNSAGVGYGAERTFTTLAQ